MVEGSETRIYAANGNPRKRRPDSKPALFFFPSPLLSFRRPPKKKSANREMHSTYPAGTFPKLMRDEITAPPSLPRGSGRQSRRLLERHWRRCPFPPHPFPASFSFNLFYLCFFLFSFFFFSSSWSFFSPPLLSNAPRTHEEGEGFVSTRLVAPSERLPFTKSCP